MKKDFELSRRDPIAHNALMTRRREEEARKLRQHVASFPQQSGASKHHAHSTQPSRWDHPLIATGDMLLPPSTAPAGGPLLYEPTIANPSAAVSPNLDQPQTGSLPDSNSTAGKGASVRAPKQTHPRFGARRRLSGTPDFTSRDLQKHIEDSITVPDTSGSSPRNSANGNTTEVDGKMNESKENRGGRKRSDPADEEHKRKKLKRALAPTPGPAHWEAMNKTFEDFLSREADRPSKGRS